jgi:hypothetical protein
MQAKGVAAAGVMGCAAVVLKLGGAKMLWVQDDVLQTLKQIL